RVHQVEGKNQPVTVDGAWRLWPEHGGNTPQIQGAGLAPFTTTNPDHVFEIHPVTRFDGIDTSDGVDVIEGFQTKDADTAFQAYRFKQLDDGHPEWADRGLPYEMIIVGVYPDHPEVNN